MGQILSQNNSDLIRPSGPLPPYAVTPSDSANLDPPARALYVGTTGDLALEYKDGSQVTFVGVAAGVTHELGAVKVLATGTTASNIVAIP